MAEIQYKLIEAGQPKAPPISLLRISGDRNLTVSLKVFGPNTFDANVAEMQKQYSHPETGQIITFREPTTAESILAASYDFTNRAKPEIFDQRGLQAGRILKTSEGVFVNLPRDAQGNLVTNEQTLKSFLNRVKPVKVRIGKFYIVPNSNNLRDFGYAEYNSFVRGVQDAGDFVEGGLARVLEHTEKTAEKLKEIASEKNYLRRVHVLGFDNVEIPVLKVARLDSFMNLGVRQLGVLGDGWLDCGGYAFGVLK